MTSLTTGMNPSCKDQPCVNFFVHLFNVYVPWKELLCGLCSTLQLSMGAQQTTQPPRSETSELFPHPFAFTVLKNQKLVKNKKNSTKLERLAHHLDLSEVGEGVKTTQK